jgi:hypothetical protein
MRATPGRPIASVSALLLVVTVVGGCAGPAGTDGSGTPDCAAPQLEISAPVLGAVLHPGPFHAAGVVGGAYDDVSWQVADASGAELDEGTAEVVRGGGRSTFSLPLELPEGGYRLEVRPASGPGSSPTCEAVGSDFTVAPESTAPTWLSGASGVDIPTGDFGRWRGTDVAITGTWSDQNGGQLELWPLVSGGLLADWDGNLEIAVGALENGETWAAAAQGAYDDRWRESVRRMARLWEGRSGQLFIRLAHEFNGDWFPWSITTESRDDFIESWRRYRAIQLAEFPQAALVFSPNNETTADGLDWRTAFPGSEYVDVLSMSYFNAYPWTDTVEDFWNSALRYDEEGGPQGIQRHLEFARSVGLPFAVSEWSNNALFGDSGVYMQQMDQIFRANAGTGPGMLRYEILFNVVHADNPFSLMPETNAPEAAETYRRLW